MVFHTILILQWPSRLLLLLLPVPCPRFLLPTCWCPYPSPPCRRLNFRIRYSCPQQQQQQQHHHRFCRPYREERLRRKRTRSLQHHTRWNQNWERTRSGGHRKTIRVTLSHELARYELETDYKQCRDIKWIPSRTRSGCRETRGVRGPLFLVRNRENKAGKTTKADTTWYRSLLLASKHFLTTVIRIRIRSRRSRNTRE